MTKTLLLGALVVVSAGCIIVAEDGPYRTRRVVDYEASPPEPYGDVVVVERHHVHTAGCGHYWYNGRWYQHPGHVHGPGCGHVYHEGAWVLAGAVVVKEAHVHDAHCGHYWHSGNWYYMHRHTHGPGCGHYWDNSKRVWIAVKW